MKSKTKLSKYVIAVAAVWGVHAVVLVLSYFMLSQPQKMKLTQLETQFKDSQGQLEQARLAAQDESKAKIQQRWEQTRSLINNFSTQEETVTELVFDIGQIANELRLIEFSSKNQSQPDHSTVGDGKSLGEAWLNVEFVSTFRQFSEFINRLERNCPVIFVEEVLFRRGAGNSKGHKATLKLSFLAETKTKGKKVALATGG